MPRIYPLCRCPNRHKLNCGSRSFRPVPSGPDGCRLSSDDRARDSSDDAGLAEPAVLARSVRPRILPRPQRSTLPRRARGGLRGRSRSAVCVHARLAVGIRHPCAAPLPRTALRQTGRVTRVRDAAGRRTNARGAPRHGSAGNGGRPAARPSARGDERTAARAGALRTRRHAGGLRRYLRRRAPDALPPAAGRRVVRQRACHVGANAHRGRPRQPRDGRGAPRPWPGREQAVQSRERQVPGGIRRTEPRGANGAHPRRCVEHPDRGPGRHHRARRRAPRHRRAHRPRRVRAERTPCLRRQLRHARCRLGNQSGVLHDVGGAQAAQRAHLLGEGGPMDGARHRRSDEIPPLRRLPALRGRRPRGRPRARGHRRG